MRELALTVAQQGPSFRQPRVVRSGLGDYAHLALHTTRTAASLGDRYSLFFFLFEGGKQAINACSCLGVSCWRECVAAQTILMQI